VYFDGLMNENAVRINAYTSSISSEQYTTWKDIGIDLERGLEHQMTEERALKCGDKRRDSGPETKVRSWRPCNCSSYLHAYQDPIRSQGGCVHVEARRTPGLVIIEVVSCLRLWGRRLAGDVRLMTLGARMLLGSA
jgi:hypothetical protein